MGNDKKLKILLDTGSNKNYINPKFIKSRNKTKEILKQSPVRVTSK